MAFGLYNPVGPNFGAPAPGPVVFTVGPIGQRGGTNVTVPQPSTPRLSIPTPSSSLSRNPGPIVPPLFRPLAPPVAVPPRGTFGGLR